MFKFKQGKRLIISLICLMVIALVTFSGFTINSNLKKIKNQSNAASVEYIYVSTPEELLDAAKKLKSISNTLGLNIPPEIEITIGKDIDMQGKPFFPIGMNCEFNESTNTITAINDYIYSFRFWVNGCGHTIKNLTINTEVEGSDLGLLYRAKAGTIVERLKIENMTININSNSSLQTCSGSIIGYLDEMADRATAIMGVEVDGLTINNNGSYNKHYAAGFIGMANDVNENRDLIIVSYCMLKNFNTKNIQTGDTKLVLNKMGDATRLSISEIVAINCIDVEWCPTTWYDNDAEKTWSSITTEMLFTDHASAVAQINSLGTGWYLPVTSEFNDGNLAIEEFIDFYTYHFDTDGDDSNYEISVELPAYYWEEGSTREKITSIPFSYSSTTIYGTNISPAQKDGYSFDRWKETKTDGDDKWFSAEFIKEMIDIHFLPIVLEYEGETIFCNATDNVNNDKNKNETFTIEDNLLTSTINILGITGGGNIGIINENETNKVGYYYLYSNTNNDNLETWKLHVLKTLWIGEREATHLLGKHKTISQIINELGLDLNSVLSSGLKIKVELTIKTYGVEVE